MDNFSAGERELMYFALSQGGAREATEVEWVTILKSKPILCFQPVFWYSFALNSGRNCARMLLTTSLCLCDRRPEG